MIDFTLYIFAHTAFLVYSCIVPNPCCSLSKHDFYNTYYFSRCWIFQLFNKISCLNCSLRVLKLSPSSLQCQFLNVNVTGRDSKSAKALWTVWTKTPGLSNTGRTIAWRLLRYIIDPLRYKSMVTLYTITFKFHSLSVSAILQDHLQDELLNKSWNKQENVIQILMLRGDNWMLLAHRP